MESFDHLLEQSAASHGHLCPGQVVGVRMALLGCRLIGLDDPRSRDQIKKLLVYVEMDRCTADAVAYVTGVKLGRRSLKFMDYGIMAATFVNLETDRAFRIISSEESRDLCSIYAPELEEKSKQQICAYKRMPDSVLFRVQKVHVPVREVDLPAFNMVDEVMCATLHSHTLVKKGRQVAATRAIPLVMKRAPVERAAAIAGHNGGILRIRPLETRKTGIVITGNEVFSGLIEDKFAPILRKKILDLGSTVSGITFAPDDESLIHKAIETHLSDGCNLILLSGGMSVDPDDVTRKGIFKAGVTEMQYGAAALPGAMFMVAYIGDTPLIGVPACGLHHRVTVLDLVLPRILAGEHVGKKELAFLGHGGLCMDCPECVHPHCPFGKGM